MAAPVRRNHLWFPLHFYQILGLLWSSPPLHEQDSSTPLVFSEPCQPCPVFLPEHERSTAFPLHSRCAHKLGLECTSTRARSPSHSFIHTSQTSPLPHALPFFLSPACNFPLTCRTLHCEAFTHLPTHIALQWRKAPLSSEPSCPSTAAHPEKSVCAPCPPLAVPSRTVSLRQHPLCNPSSHRPPHP